MKKHFQYALMVALLLGVLSSIPASAFFPLPPGPTTPDADPATDTTNGLAYYMEQLTKKFNNFATQMEDTSKKIQSLEDKASLVSFLSEKTEAAKETLSVKKEKGKSSVDSAKKIEECTIADIKSEESVAEAFKKLFTKYPADILKKHPLDSKIVTTAYRKKGVEFSNDIMIEAYLVSRQLQERMDALREDYNTLTECYVDGKKSNGDSCKAASDTSDEVGIIVNYYRLNAIYDSLLRIAEELTALNAQYRAAQTLREGIRPIMPEEEENAQNNSEGDNSEGENQAFNFRMVEKMSFAQMLPSSSGEEPQQKQPEEQNNAQNDEKKASPNASKLDKLRDELTPVVMKEPELSSLLKGTDEVFEDMALYDELYGKLSNAQKIHNFKVVMPFYREVFVNVRQIRILYEEALKRLNASKQCAINHLTTYYGGGIDEAFLSWVRSSYQATKAQTAVEVTEDEFSPRQVDDFAGTGDLSQISELEKTLRVEQDSETGDSALRHPSLEEPHEKNVRGQEVLSWLIGEQAVEDISADMKASGVGTDKKPEAMNVKWGVPVKPYPLWEDEKYFYKEYVLQKYNNMKIFIQNLNMRGAVAEIVQTMLDSLDAGEEIDDVSAVDVKKYGNKALSQLSGSLGAPDKENADLEEIKKQIDESYKKMEETKSHYKELLESLERKKQGLYQEYDNYNVELTSLKEDYNNFMDEKNKADVNAQTQDIVLDINQERMDKSKYATDVLANMATEDKKVAEETSVQKQKEAEALLEKMEILREKIDDVRARIDDIKNLIEATKDEFGGAMYGLSKENEALWEQAWELAATPKDDVTLSSALDTLSDKSGDLYAIFSDMVSTADNLMADAVADAIKRIDEALQQYDELGKDFYKPEEADKVLKIHTDLMRDLQMQPLKSTLGSFEDVVDSSQILSMAQNVFQKTLMTATCQGGSCYAPDTEFFVGLPAKARDFTAPKKIEYTYTPPMREIVHFDTIDYDTVVKTVLDELARDALLEYDESAYLPEIWHRILGPKGFIENNFNAKKMLEAFDPENTAPLLNGGEYPCKAGKYIIGFKDNALTLWQENDSSLQECSGIEEIEVQSSGKVNVNFENGDQIVGRMSSDFSDEDAESMCNSSELATLLSYTGKYTYNGKLKEIYKFFAEAYDGKNLSESDSGKVRVYKNALLVRNQFGDYLNFVELVENYKKVLDEMEVKLDETRESIKKSLKVINYEPPADFDLADKATYDEIMKKLETAKNGLIEEVVPKIKTMHQGNEGMDENIQKLKDMVSALQLDKDEVVSLSDNMKGDSELAEKIKSKMADIEIVNRYNKEAETAAEKEIRNFGTPYCASTCDFGS